MFWQANERWQNVRISDVECALLDRLRRKLGLGEEAQPATTHLNPVEKPLPECTHAAAFTGKIGLDHERVPFFNPNSSYIGIGDLYSAKMRGPAPAVGMTLYTYGSMPTASW